MTNKCCWSFCLLLLLTVANSGCVGITSARGTAQAAARTGLGLNLSASTLNFGAVDVGSSSALALTLTNSGQSTITISNISVSGPGFNASGIPTGMLLNPGQTATLEATFAPAASGSASGNVTITSNSGNSPATIGLSGAGVESTGGQSSQGGVGGQSGGSGVVTSIVVTPADPILVPGTQLQFRAVDNFGNDITSSVIWSSSNASIATITPEGLATALSDGNATINATE